MSTLSGPINILFLIFQSEAGAREKKARGGGGGATAMKAKYACASPVYR